MGSTVFVLRDLESVSAKNSGPHSGGSHTTFLMSSFPEPR